MDIHCPPAYIISYLSSFCKKLSGKSKLRDEGIIVAYRSRMQPIVAGKQKHKAAGHIAYAVRKQRVRNTDAQLMLNSILFIQISAHRIVPPTSRRDLPPRQT